MKNQIFFSDCFSQRCSSHEEIKALEEPNFLVLFIAIINELKASSIKSKPMYNKSPLQVLDFKLVNMRESKKLKPFKFVKTFIYKVIKFTLQKNKHIDHGME